MLIIIDFGIYNYLIKSKVLIIINVTTPFKLSYMSCIFSVIVRTNFKQSENAEASTNGPCILCEFQDSVVDILPQQSSII